MAVDIRIMQKDDYSEALNLWRNLPGLGLSGADEEKEIHHFLDKNPMTCFVAVDQNKIVGTILGGSDARRGYIYHLAVEMNHQRKGLGKDLVNICLGALKATGLQKCHIFVISNNLEGMRFWENIKWTSRPDILVMSKDL